MDRFCTKCGTPLDPNTHLCPNCDRPRARFCTRCGAPLNPVSGLCPSCDTPKRQVLSDGQSSFPDQNGAGTPETKKETKAKKNSRAPKEKSSKALKIVLIILLILALIGAGIFVYFKFFRSKKCSKDTYIKVADANGKTYNDFVIQVKETDQSFACTDGVYVSDLGLEEGSYTLSITEVNGEETEIEQKIEVTADTDRDENEKDDSDSDTLVIETGDPMTDADLYRPILLKYIQAIDEKWTSDKLKSEDMYTFLPYTEICSGSDKMCCCLKDVDGNGREELFLYSANRPYMIYAVYMIGDNDTVKSAIMASGYDPIYYNGGQYVSYAFIGNPNCVSNPPGTCETNEYYKIQDGEVFFIEGTCGTLTGDEAFWHITRESGEYTAESITKSEYESIQGKYPQTELEGKLLSEIKITKSDALSWSSLPETFTFASGVGAWRTVLTIQSDGSFTGKYTDSDMGVTGSDYPDGTCYICNFTGQFDKLVKENDDTYTTSVKSLTCEGTEGDTYIEKGIKYIISSPYGLANAKEIKIYLPGAAFSDLPQGFLNWYKRAWASDNSETALPDGVYGLYNVNEEYGFVGEKTGGD